MLALAPPASATSPPVAGPLCAIASEVAPAIMAAASLWFSASAYERSFKVAHHTGEDLAEPSVPVPLVAMGCASCNTLFEYHAA
jgi:hypothetical protein